jgi:ketosteroid isomerase-like protein
MKIKPVAASLCLAAVVGGLGRLRGDDPETKAAIQAIFNKIAEAVQKKDIDGVTKYSLPTATVTYATGTELTLAQWQEQARKSWVHIKAVRSRIAVEEVKRDGDTAEARYTETHHLVVSDPMGGKEHKIDYQGKWCATVTQTSAGWRLRRSVELARKLTRDGVLVEERPKGAFKP